MTAGELIAALQMARQVGDARQPGPSSAKPDSAKPEGDRVTAPAAMADENVASLSSARHIK